MPTLTLSIPEDLKKTMDELKIINWSAVARQAIQQRALQLKVLQEFTKDSELTEKDALELGRKVNKELSKRYKESLKEE